VICAFLRRVLLVTLLGALVGALAIAGSGLTLRSSLAAQTGVWVALCGGVIALGGSVTLALSARRRGTE
jgi:hypothetical protein